VVSGDIGQLDGQRYGVWLNLKSGFGLGHHVAQWIIPVQPIVEVSCASAGQCNVISCNSCRGLNLKWLWVI